MKADTFDEISYEPVINEEGAGVDKHISRKPDKKGINFMARMGP